MNSAWLVTGASRGIGLEYARQLAVRGTPVIATARHPEEAEDLAALKTEFPEFVRVEQLDVGNGASIDDFAGRLAGAAIEVLINNAGLYGGSWDTDSGRQSPQSMDYALWEEILRVNAIGPFRLSVALLNNLKLGQRRVIVNMSSDLGSITNNTQGQSHAYRSSKAALNMITKGLSIELAGDGFTVVSMAPGWTKTDLGGVNAEWNTDESVRRQLVTIAGLTPEDTGTFVNLRGETVPW